MAKAPSLRQDRNTGAQRTRKLCTVDTVQTGEMRRNASWREVMEKDRRC